MIIGDKDMRNGTDAPLEGVRVLEFGQIAAGPFVGMLLADLGADVVKVERPDGGDSMRGWPPLTEPDTSGNRFSGSFAALNRNKRSIVVDFGNSSALARLRSLCAASDIVLENFRPGVLAKRALDYQSLKASNPSLVYCSLSGYGQSGPYAHKGAFDVTVQAMSGIMSVTGNADGAPVKCGVPVGDFVAGLYAVVSVLAALRRTVQTGRGAHVDCSMLGSLLAISALQTAEVFTTGVAPGRLGSSHPRNAPYQAFSAREGQFTVAAGNQELWCRFCEVIERPDLVQDSRFVTQESRARNQQDLEAILNPVFVTRTAGEWLEAFDSHGIPCAPINDFGSILADAHVRQMGILHDLRLPDGSRISAVGFPVNLTGFEFRVKRGPPDLGEHTSEVFDEWLSMAAR